MPSVLANHKNKGHDETSSPTIDANDLVTMRFRFRTNNATQKHGHGKTLIDISQVPRHFVNKGSHIGGPHRAIDDVCPSAASDYVLPLGIHHHAGSLESYLSRNDSRAEEVSERSVTAWVSRAMGSDGGPDDEVRPWLQGFVDSVGAQAALRLLQGAGEVSNVTRLSTAPANVTNWTDTVLLQLQKTEAADRP